MSYFIFLHSPNHHLLENFIFYCFIHPNVGSMRAGHFYAFCSLLCSQCLENAKHLLGFQ